MGLKERLEKIASDEIAFTFRKLDIILINSNSGKMKDLKIQARRFHPNKDNISIEIESCEISPKGQGNVSWQLYGDSASQDAIHKFLTMEIQKMAVINEKVLRNILYKAIKLGIRVSGKSKYGNHLNCGGKHFVKSIQ